MPIRPSERKRYPKNWKAIRAAVLERAGYCCEFCGVRNTYRVNRGRHGNYTSCSPGEGFFAERDKTSTRVVLTVAHLDHTPEHNDQFEVKGTVNLWGMTNLAALCQRCHNRYDAAMRACGRRRRARD